jgi:hypothetical protein
MQISVEDRRTRYILFLLLGVSINVIDGMLTRSMAVNPRAHAVVAVGATFDVIVVVTLIYYWLLVRPGIQGRSSLFPIALMGLLHATYLYPNATSARLALAGLCEIGLIGFVVVQVRRKIRLPNSAVEGDPIGGIRAALAPVFVVPVAANLFAVELGVLYYALFSWRSKPHAPSEARAFSMHKRAAPQDLLFALAIVCIVEIPAMHLIIHIWSPVWAWLASALGVYGAIWLVGLARSIELRPVLVGPDYLELRYGLLFRLRVPRLMLLQVRSPALDDATSAVTVPRSSEPNLCIELRSPMYAEGLFGVRKRVSRVAVAVDESSAFEQALRDLMETDQ